MSQNPRGRESKAERLARRDALVEAWAEPFGGAAVLGAAELALLQQAAELSLIRPRSAEDRVRIANTISKILAQVGLVDKRRAPREPARPDLAEHFTAKYGNEAEGDEQDGAHAVDVASPTRSIEVGAVPVPSEAESPSTAAAPAGRAVADDKGSAA